MLPLCFVAIYAAAVCAESPSIGSYSSQGGSLRDYDQYTGRSAENLMGAKSSYSELTGSYITLTGSPYSKGDTRYVSSSGASNSNSESSDSRASLTGSSSGNDGGSLGGSSSGSGNDGASNSGSNLYKTKYANDATVNAIRPSYQSLATAQESTLQAHNPAYASSISQSSNYYGPAYSERGQGSYTVSGESVGHSEYASAQGRPVASQYPGYIANSQPGEYLHTSLHTRPSSYSYGGLAPASDYPSGSGHRVQASYPVSDEQYQGHAMSAHSPAVQAAAHPYKSYIMSNPQSSFSSSSSNKYQTVLGAIKSLFGGGNTEASPSPSFPPAYFTSSAGHGYYSPVHSANQHAPALTSPSMASTSPHYFSSGSSVSNSPYPTAYSKSYPPMRPMSNYGFNSASPGTNTAGKIVVLRDSMSAAHGATYTSAAGSLLASPSSYAPVKNKISMYAPTGPSYISAAPSSLSYSSSPYSGSYPSSATFPNAHGGSTFLGYSAN